MTKDFASSPRLELLVQWGLLMLVALMPFHAFLSVWLGSLTHQGTIIQAWKESLLVLLAAGSTWLLVQDPSRLKRLRQPWVGAAGALLAVALIVTLITRPPLAAMAFGLKTDFEFMLAAVIALLVATPVFIKRLVATVVATAIAVSAFTAAEVWLLPANFLTHFGYGPNTVAPFQHIAAGISTLRFPGTLGGPNQLGTYIILPLCLMLALVRRHPWLWLGVAGALVAVATSYSRGAWLGAALAIACTGWMLVPATLRKKYLAVVLTAGALALSAIPLTLNHDGPWQYLLLHSSVANHDNAELSDSQHAQSLHEGINANLQHPLGQGLGTAGPATFHTGTPHIIENYYLQLGYEAGLLGLAAFLVCVFLLLRQLWPLTIQPLAIAGFAAIVGISLVALVLPAWTDSSTALIAWICAGAVCGNATTKKAIHV